MKKIFIYVISIVILVLSVAVGLLWMKKESTYQLYQDGIQITEYKDMVVYSDITKDAFESEKIDAEIEEEVLQLEKKYSVFKEVDREIRRRDIVNVHISGTTNKNNSFLLESYDYCIDGDAVLLGLSEALLGHKAGDVIEGEFTFNNTYEDGLYSDESIMAKIEINKVSKTDDQELTNAFVKEKIGYRSLSEYKKELKKIYALKYDVLNMENVRLDVVDAVLANSQVELEEDEVQSKTKELLEEYEDTDLDIEINEMKEAAEERLKRDTVIDAIAKKEKINLKDQKEDIELAVAKAYYYSNPEEMREANGDDVVDRYVKEYIVSKWLVEHNKVIDKK